MDSAPSSSSTSTSTSTIAAAGHAFRAVAFVENLPLKELAATYPEAKRSPHQLRFGAHGGDVFIYPFGAIVFRDVAPEAQQVEVERLRRARPGLTHAIVTEELVVREDPGRQPVVADGVLTMDRLTADRASVVALTV